MLEYLHITNGDGAANILKTSAVDGDVLPWRDPMHHGPFPAKFSLDEVSRLRAKYLSMPGSRSEAECEFHLRDLQLKSAQQYQEVILWFEHDLLDQLQILQLLDWFFIPDHQPPALSIICIDRFDSIKPFRGLGQLNSEQMASLFKTRQPVTHAHLHLAKQGWAAFRCENPQSLETFLASDLQPLPFLKAALQRHLEEFPWINDGLTRTERQILTLISNGTSRPGDIFVKNMEYETALFIGDWMTYSLIENLCTTQVPLLSCISGQTFQTPQGSEISAEEFHQQDLFLTSAGNQVLAGELDGFSAIDRDNWLGGIHLTTGQPMWMWNAKAAQLDLRQP